MGFRALSGPAGFALGAGLRAIAISALAFAALMAAQHQLHATVLVLGGLAVLVAVDLARSTRAADRLLAQFVEGVTAEGYERPATPPGLRDLGVAIQAALDRLAGVRAERQQRNDFLEALADTVAAALLVVDAGGRITAVNRAARTGLGAAAGPLEAVAALGSETARRLLALPVGGREVVRLANQQAMLAQVTGFSSGGAERRLIALQSIAGDLDAVELKAWQDLVRVLAHEMMNSLTPICSLSERIAERLRATGDPATDLIPDLIEDAEVIGRRGEGLMRFVQGYRQLAEVPTVVKARTPAADLVRRLDRLAAGLIGEAPIAYASRVETAGLVLEADAELLEQAIINLLKNAIEAVRDRPGAAVSLTVRIEDGQVALTVADNGPGLAAGDPEAAFVPFYTTKADGSGVGLALARQIALAHGGRLEHRPSAAGGAAFRLSLPVG